MADLELLQRGLTSARVPVSSMTTAPPRTGLIRDQVEMTVPKSADSEEKPPSRQDSAGQTPDWQRRNREQDLEWRSAARQEDRQWRQRESRLANRRAALFAAAEAAQSGATPDVIFDLAERFEAWLTKSDQTLQT